MHNVIWKKMIFDGGPRSLKSSVQVFKNLKIVSNKVAVGEETNGRQIHDTIPPDTEHDPCEKHVVYSLFGRIEARVAEHDILVLLSHSICGHFRV
jgi:hypothetical protein